MGLDLVNLDREVVLSRIQWLPLHSAPLIKRLDHVGAYVAEISFIGSE